MKVCQPNPCFHGGICSSISSSHYTCDCSRTGYKGTNCDVGQVIIPDYPILTPGVSSQPLSFQTSPPDDYIVLTFLSRDLEFNPPHTVFRRGLSAEQLVTITGRHPGIYFIRYSLSGPSAGEFQTPQENIIVIKSAKNSTTESDPLSQGLPSGCHKQQLNKCPHTNEIIVASSTSPWVTFGPLSMSSGVVNVEVGATKLPLSLVGANLPKSNLISFQKRCNETDISYSTEQLIKSRSLVKSYLNNMRDSLPKWLRVTLRNHSSTETILSSELMSRYLTGRLLRDADIGEGQPISEETFYSLLMSPDLNLTIGNDVDLLGSGDRKTLLSLAVDLCGPSPKNVIVRPSLGNEELVNNISVVKKLQENGWNFTFYSLQISKKKLIKKLEKGKFWNGKRFFETSSATNGNIAILSSFTKYFREASVVNSSVEFQGTIVADHDNVDNVSNDKF